MTCLASTLVAATHIKKSNRKNKNSINSVVVKTNSCYCEQGSHLHTDNIWSYWAISGIPLQKTKVRKPDDNINCISNLNSIIPVSPVKSISTSGGFGNLWFGHHDISSGDSSVLTCCALDGRDSIPYLKTHIHNLLDKNDDIDELTKEKQLNGDLSPWDVYSTPDENQKSSADSELPTNIQNFNSRHDKLFLKFKHVFSRKVRVEPANLPSMVLKVDDNLWSSSRHRLPPRLQSQIKQDEIERQCSQMKALNVIIPSQSTEWSQVTLAAKPNNKWRFCIDYKYLNLITKGNGYPIPLISLIIQRISRKKARYYAVIDLTSGYHQAPLAKESRKYTAFRTLNALYEWLRVPFGLKGAPAWFQFIMATIVLVDILYIACELYLDDILIFGETEDEYFRNLEQVLTKLDKYSIIANPDKGQFGMTEVDYVGHHFTQFGVTHNRDRIQKVLEIEQPKFAKQLKSFVGVVEYFHEHVQDFSEILRPLRKLITPYVKTHTIKWTDLAVEAFNNVKTAINNCQTLYFIDDSAPIYLHTDASDYGIGGYLFQVVDNKEKPVMFMSKSLSASEIKWSTIDKEAYAIVYSLYKFKHLIQGVHFVLRTDHKNLTFVNESKSERVQRWKNDIQEYDFVVEHIEGVKNVPADAFSRLIDLNPEQLNSLTSSESEMLCAFDDDMLCAFDDYTHDNDKYNIISYCHNSTVGHHGVDRTIAKIKLKVTSSVIKKWSKLRFDVRAFIAKCPICQKLSVIKTPIQTIKYTLSAYEPMQRLSIDTININTPDEYGNTSIIVIIDCFSRWIELFAAQDYSAKSAAIALLHFVGRFGVPEYIHSDKGTQYLNDLLHQFTLLIGGIQTFNISSYSHEENGMVERANKEILRHLRALIFDKNSLSDWSIDLPLVQRILNSSINESIGTSAAHILFGNAINLNRGIFLPPSERPTFDNLSPWLAERLSSQDEIITRAKALQREINNSHISHTGNNLTEYSIDDLVLVDYPTSSVHKGPPNKLLSNRRGPMKIVARNGDNYSLADLATNKEIEVYHVKYLHKFNYDKEHTNPRTVANSDKQFFDIDKIISHRGDKQSPSRMKFQVLWMPVNNLTAQKTWEPWKTLRNTHALHKYLSENKMKALIPSIYK
jgi:hypothetical protein